MINNAVAVKPKILTSIKKFFKFLEIVFKNSKKNDGVFKNMMFSYVFLQIEKKDRKKEHKKKIFRKFKTLVERF
jgi:hypothetical protein